jgi:hypothetical protein
MSQNEARYRQIRALVATAGARFVSITFIKKNGEERTMVYNQLAAAPRVKGEAASEQAQRATATRAERNPNLLNVWDNGKQAFRSINMDTIKTVKVDKVEYHIA